MNTCTSVAFIVARLSSSRLPGKQLRTIGGAPLLQWILSALKRCREVDRIVLATVAEVENQPLREWAGHQTIDCFWYEGATDHVTTRLRKAAEHYGADVCILISADCPLLDPQAIDALIRSLKATPGADYAVTPNDADHQSCMLQGVLVATRDSWQRGDDVSDRPELKEHHFPVFGLRPDLFTALPCWLDPALYGLYHRLSIDTWSDLSFCNRLYDLLKGENKDFTLANVVDLLKKQPHLKTINQHVHQKKLIENTQRLLLAFSPALTLTAFAAYKKLALQIIDRLGWPIAFLNADEYADQIKEIGMRTVSTLPLCSSDTHNPRGCFDLLVLVTDGEAPSSWRQLPQDLLKVYLDQSHHTDEDKKILYFSPVHSSDKDIELILSSLQKIAAGAHQA